MAKMIRHDFGAIHEALNKMYENNTQVRYQIKPIDQKGDLYGSMRDESTLTLITD